MRMFRPFLERHQNSKQVFEEIEDFLFEKAEKISSRVVNLVRRLKQNDLIYEQSFFNWTYQIINPKISPICSKILNQNQNYSAFKCYDCIESVSSCICATCFENGDHKGHNYIQYQAINGCCDCGNQQSWNSKGNCRDHGINSEEQLKIDDNIKQKYLKELQFAFWIYFYYCNKNNINKLRQRYGKALFIFIAKLCSQNYQMKYLAYLLLNQSLSIPITGKKQLQNMTIIQRIFRLPKENQELHKFVQLTFEIFPVEQFRIIVIKQYFQATRSRQSNLTRNHPLATLNFQFLSCVKLITKLVEKNQILPLSLYSKKSNITSQVFKKYYEDLDYINNMNSAKDYYIQHLSKLNICQMCFYRSHASEVVGQQELIKYNLDQIFLKQLGIIITKIGNNKQILLKCLKQLFDEICICKINKISMAHERAFALLFISYFEGNIYKILNNEICKQFIDNLNINKQKIKYILYNTLLSKIYIYRYGDIQYDNESHERYFLKLHPQKNFNQFLDIIFHKIIILLSNNRFNYDEIIQQILNSFEIQKIQQKLYDKQDDKQIQSILIKQYQKIYILLNFINTASSIKIDQIVISNYINYSNQNQILYFYGRLLSTYKNINIKDFKNLSLSIINKQQIFQKFIKEKCIIQKGKIKTIEIIQPLQTYIYKQIFKKYQINNYNIDLYLLNKNIKLLQFNNIIIFNQNSIHKIMELIMFLQFRFTSLKYYQKCTNIFSLISFQFLKIYLWDNNIKQKSFFHSLLKQSFRTYISSQLLQQITFIEKGQELQGQRAKMKGEKEIVDKKKRQKLLAKKKEKQQLLKKNQQKFLQSYSMKPQQDYNIQQCIYCKSIKNQQLNYVAFIGVTNFYEQSYLDEKIRNYHVYFQSCGHEIHRSCLDASIFKNKSNYCYLCKRQTNLLIPKLSQNKSISNNDQLIDLITLFQVALISQRQDIKSQIKDKDIILAQKSNFYDMILQGMARDILFIGLQDKEYFIKNRAKMYYQIYIILKETKFLSQKQSLKQFQSLNKIQNLLVYTQNKLKASIFGFQNQKFKGNIAQNDKLLIDRFIQNLINKGNYSNVVELPLQNQKLYIQLPQNLNKMNEFIGSCKLCQHVTNYIYICLKCSWNCCRKCLNQMYKHTSYYHLDGSIFISCTNGAVKYLHNGFIFEDESIYQNYVGQSYTQLNSRVSSSTYEKYLLNQEKFKNIKKIGLRYGIHQKIFINEH